MNIEMTPAASPETNIQADRKFQFKWNLTFFSSKLSLKQLYFLTPIPYTTEPVGAKAPTLVSDVKFFGIDRRFGSSITLLCPAQGFPAPNFRSATENECDKSHMASSSLFYF